MLINPKQTKKQLSWNNTKYCLNKKELIPIDKQEGKKLQFITLGFGIMFHVNCYRQVFTQGPNILIDLRQISIGAQIWQVHCLKFKRETNKWRGTWKKRAHIPVSLTGPCRKSLHIGLEQRDLFCNGMRLLEGQMVALPWSSQGVTLPAQTQFLPCASCRWVDKRRSIIYIYFFLNIYLYECVHAHACVYAHMCVYIYAYTNIQYSHMI